MSSLDLPERLLLHLDKNGELDTYKFATEINENHQKVVGAVKCLEALGGMITTEPYSFVEWFLTAEGKLVSTNGSHEAIVYQAIPPEGITKEQLAALVPNIYNIGLSKAMVNGWIYFDKTCASGKPLLKHKVDSIKDIVKEQLLAFEKNPESINVTVKNEYKKRKLIQELTTKGFKLGKGENFTLSIIKPETDLTPEMIASGSWKDVKFKPYNFNALGAPSECGALHPLLKVREQFRQIFLEMGFTEMATNNYVESSFWNFDALFQPQQHPARDAHDTFFVAEPKSTNTFPQEYLERVKQVHSTGGFGSQGYGYDWKYTEAQKNLLRTHTTAVSAKMLYALAQKGFTPAKYFSIDRVFRNETLDATHLAEFHQVEGVVADYNLTLGDLIGTLHEFFNKLGLGNLHFKPAYNPYTEPSMEIFSYHPGLDKYIEVGNSGVFRPEMLLPMGLPANVNVIAWGLSLERPTMIKYGFNNIRSLVGPKVDLEMVQQSPLCRLDKVRSKDQILEDLEDRLASAIQQLRDLQENFPPQKKKEDGNHTEAVIMADPIQQLGDLQENFPPQEKKEDGNHTEAVIMADPIQQLRDLQENFPPQEKKEDGNHTEAMIIADPHHPPFSLIVLLKLLGADSVSGHVHLHSSVVSVSPSLTNLVENIFKKSTGKKKLNIKFVWNADCKTPKLFLYPFSTSLMGEVTIARYLNNWVEMQQSPAVIYKTRGAIFSGQIDSWLDLLHGSMVYGDEKKRAAALRQIDAVLGQRAWLIDSQPTIADICWWSLLKGLRARKLSSTVRLWVEKCNGHKLFALE